MIQFRVQIYREIHAEAQKTSNFNMLKSIWLSIWERSMGGSTTGTNFLLSWQTLSHTPQYNIVCVCAIHRKRKAVEEKYKGRLRIKRGNYYSFIQYNIKLYTWIHWYVVWNLNAFVMHFWKSMLKWVRAHTGGNQWMQK